MKTKGDNNSMGFFFSAYKLMGKVSWQFLLGPFHPKKPSNSGQNKYYLHKTNWVRKLKNFVKKIKNWGSLQIGRTTFLEPIKIGHLNIRFILSILLIQVNWANRLRLQLRTILIVNKRTMRRFMSQKKKTKECDTYS